MARISFSPEQARGVARSIKNKGDATKGVVEQLDREIKSVEGWWEGDSARAL